jgi:hypothetical protein
MNHSASYRVEALHIRPDVIRKVPIDVHRLWHSLGLHAIGVRLESPMVLVDPLLPLIVVVSHSVGHWCNNDLPGLEYVSRLRVGLIVAHQILHEVVGDLWTDALVAVKCP